MIITNIKFVKGAFKCNLHPPYQRHKKLKRLVITGRKALPRITKDFHSEFMNNSANLRKRNNPIKSGQNIWTDTLPSNIHSWRMDSLNMFNIINYEGNATQNHNVIS